MHGDAGNALGQRLRQDRRLARRESDRRYDVEVAGRCLGRIPGGRSGELEVGLLAVRVRVRLGRCLGGAYLVGVVVGLGPGLGATQF